MKLNTHILILPRVYPLPGMQWKHFSDLPAPGMAPTFGITMAWSPWTYYTLRFGVN